MTIDLDRLILSRAECERGIERMDAMIRTMDGYARAMAVIARRDWARTCYLVQARIERMENEHGTTVENA